VLEVAIIPQETTNKLEKKAFTLLH